MTTYQHNDLIYYYDPSLRLWAVYPESLEVESIYYNNKKDLIKYNPDFKFIKRIEVESNWKAITEPITLRIN